MSVLSVAVLAGLRLIKPFGIHLVRPTHTLNQVFTDISTGANDCGNGWTLPSQHSGAGVSFKKLSKAVYAVTDFSSVTAYTALDSFCKQQQHTVSSNKEMASAQQVPGETTVGQLEPFGRFIEVTVAVRDPAATSKRDGFAMMMAAARSRTALPPVRDPEHHRKDKLYNILIAKLKTAGIGWANDQLKAAANFVGKLTALMWTIDPHKDRFTIPDVFADCFGLNNPAAQKHKVPALSMKDLEDYIHSLAGFLETPWLRRDIMLEWRTACEGLMASLVKVAAKLEKDVADARRRKAEGASDSHFSCVDLPVTTMTATAPATASAIKNIRELIEPEEPYKPVPINSALPADTMARHLALEFLRKHGSGSRASLYTKLFKNNVESLHFVWKTTEETELQGQAQAITDVQEMIPKYHSQVVKTAFRKAADSLNIAPMKARALYRIATNDATSARTTMEGAIDRRIMEFCLTEDEDIVLDLRATNHRPAKYDDFWDLAAAHIEGLSAVDDRRHDISHMALALSARDLYETIKDHCTEDIEIPSLSWFTIQFAPKNRGNRAAKLYTGRLRVKHMVQKRQLRSQHVDCHYASAIYRYMKEMAVKYSEYARLLSMDDKCKVNVGEPGQPIAAVTRGKKVLVGLDQTFAVSDHDFHRCSLTPSVLFDVKIPDTMDGSWFQGRVTVTVKDSIFQPSSPYRHAAELESQMDGRMMKPMLLMYTDGGPDHRCTYLSVMYTMVYLFLRLNTDLLVLARTPPGGSWKNPAERVMSQLNLALQAVGIMRSDAGDKEKSIEKCGTMKALREEAKRDPELQAAFSDSISGPIALVSKLFGKLKMNNEQFETSPAASHDEVEEVVDYLSTVFDTELSRTDTMAALNKRPKIKAFMDAHCQARHYSFSVKKCGLDSCGTCKEPRLPQDIFADLHHLPDPEPGEGDHYRPFNESYGRETSPAYRPGIKERSTVTRKKKQSTQEPSTSAGMSTSAETEPTVAVPTSDLQVDSPMQETFVATAQTVKTIGKGMFLVCGECSKRRLVYAAHNLTSREVAKLSRAVEDIDFVCGTDLHDFVDDGILSSILLKVNMKIHKCADPVETAYYSSDCFVDCCAACGKLDGECSCQAGPTGGRKKRSFQHVDLTN